MQSEAIYDIYMYLYKLPITWISSHFCLQRFSSIFESTLVLYIGSLHMYGYQIYLWTEIFTTTLSHFNSSTRVPVSKSVN